MAETFKLPCSSYEELIKLFQAYANTKEGTALSLDEITQATGVPRTIVSKNNGFMVQVGLITEGNKKAATETGRALGRAYTSKITDEVERIWKEIIVAPAPDIYQIRGGMFLKISKMLLIFPYRLDKLHRYNLDFQNGLKRMLHTCAAILPETGKMYHSSYKIQSH